MSAAVPQHQMGNVFASPPAQSQQARVRSDTRRGLQPSVGLTRMRFRADDAPAASRQGLRALKPLLAKLASRTKLN